MDVLVVGSGGREHTLCWKLAQSPMVDTVYCAPGNAGIARDAECIDIPVDDLEALAEFAQAKSIGLTVVGPEVPLCAGIVDIFKQRNLTTFGPSKNAAQLEGSKAYAKAFMEKYQIPTAEAQVFSEKEATLAYVRQQFDNGKKGVVIKADGLAAGKGVTVALSRDDAEKAVEECFAGAFGDAGMSVVVEECLFGEEASILALTDGKTIQSLASSQDHKRLQDGDQGPNTGGMGAYSPAPVVDAALMEQVNETVLKRFLHGIQQENLDFHGIIYAGIMVTENGPKVLEFNVRFGDPETQAVLPRLESDLADVMLKTANDQLSNVNLKWKDQTAICVVMASGGYPASYTKGYPIEGLEEAAAEGATVFHAGTALKDGKLVNNGGRVLGVTACGSDISDGIEKVYKAVAKIHWQDVVYRRDIAHRALQR